MLDVFPSCPLSYFWRQSLSLSSVMELGWLESSKPPTAPCHTHIYTWIIGSYCHTCRRHTRSHLAFDLALVIQTQVLLLVW